MGSIDLVESSSVSGVIPPSVLKVLRRGVAIPAHPLALNASRKLDERRQRALSRYYIAAGSGGLAVGVHTTQFQIRNPEIGLFAPVLEMAAEEMDRADAKRAEPLVRVGGICGPTWQAVAEAELLRDLGYHAGLLNLGALADGTDDELIDHCRAVANALPIIGFYLQPSAGGRLLSYSFWRRFVEIPQIVAIKVAPFNRYRTLDVVRAVIEAGRDDISLYTGNDDNIVMDLITPHRFPCGDKLVTRYFVGGLLGHWSAWTRSAVRVLKMCQDAVASGGPISPEMLRLAIEVTDCNSVLFDVANSFRGSTAGIHEVLRRQGLLEGTWVLSHERSVLSPGQGAELDRLYASYPHLMDDDEFVARYLDEWMQG